MDTPETITKVYTKDENMYSQIELSITEPVTRCHVMRADSIQYIPYYPVTIEQGLEGVRIVRYKRVDCLLIEELGKEEK